MYSYLEANTSTAMVLEKLTGCSDRQQKVTCRTSMARLSIALEMTLNRWLDLP
ncbi:hypothetical protein [Gloeocapsa sp. PCC 7428]|uniref:hypothetical protein n=1 Tax=Gloeocapsa sp. PCC 7428 TaxID=1173026 RepID=UPI0002F48F64|nr:hypothetical protein [Gloeocapsa sp. PCC 7428]